MLGIGAAGAERFPPQTLRLTTAGRRACSARQLVASTVGSKRKLKSAGSSVRRQERELLKTLRRALREQREALRRI